MENEPRIGVFADDHRIFAEVRSWTFEDLPGFECVIVDGREPSELAKQLDQLQPLMPRTRLAIVDQHLEIEKVTLHGFMDEYVTELKAVNPQAWVIETGMDARYHAGKMYRHSDCIVDDMTLRLELDKLYESSLSLEERLKALKRATSFATYQARLADPNNKFFYSAADSLKGALRNQFMSDVTQLLNMEIGVIQQKFSVLNEGAQRQAMHSLWTIINLHELEEADQYHGFSLDRLRSLLETGLPSKMPE